MLEINFDSNLVEEAVLVAIEGRPPAERGNFRGERNAIYQVEDRECREVRFGELHGRWFRQLGLGRPISRLLEEQPLLARGAQFCRVVRARDGREESADLLVPGSGASEPKSVVVIRLRPGTLLDQQLLIPLLRHELGHVADMLDPEFGYDARLPASGAGAWFDNLLRSRYRVLWDTRIDGRLVAAGHLPVEVEEIRRREFASMFPMLGASMEAAFNHFFCSGRSTHQELLDFACNPLPLSFHESPADGHG